MTKPKDDPKLIAINGTDALLAIEAAMTPAARKAWLEGVFEVTPSMRGAKVADVLEVLNSTDAYLPLVEPYMDHRGAELRAELDCGFTVIALAARTAIAYDTADYEPRAEAILRAVLAGKKRVVSFDD